MIIVILSEVVGISMKILLVWEIGKLVICIIYAAVNGMNPLPCWGRFAVGMIVHLIVGYAVAHHMLLVAVVVLGVYLLWMLWGG